MIAKTNPYQALVAAGVPLGSHESDLYVKVTPESIKIVRQSGWSYTPFTSQIDGSAWWDLPFAYEPFWERARQTAELLEAAKALRIDANRLCDRQLGGSYEDDCRRSLAQVDKAIAKAEGREG